VTKTQEMLRKVDQCVSDGMSVVEACKKLEIPKPTYYRWRRGAANRDQNDLLTSKTAQHILDIAEALFAGHGLEVSLREIGREAGISNGTLSYHFKSRNDLLYHITSRRQGQLNNERYKLLNNAESRNDPPLLEDIITAFYLPGLKAIVSKDVKLVNYMRFLGRVVQDPDYEVQQIVDQCFSNTHKRFIFAFSRALSAQPLEEVYWRYTAFTGIFITMTQNPNRIKRISNGQVEVTDPEIAMKRLLPILLPMMQG